MAYLTLTPSVAGADELACRSSAGGVAHPHCYTHPHLPVSMIRSGVGLGVSLGVGAGANGSRLGLAWWSTSSPRNVLLEAKQDDLAQGVLRCDVM